MSARLIKVAHGTTTQPFAPFAPPANGQRTGPAVSFEIPSTSLLIRGETPETEAGRIVADAKSRAAEIERQAREDGGALLQAEVAAEISRSVDPWREQLKTTLEELAGLRETIAAQAERDLVRLAIEIARKIVHREVTIDPEIVLTLARIGLSRVHNRTAATIHLHPEDFAFVNTRREKFEAGHVVELIEDRSIGRGGCLVHTEMGDIDARIEQQFAEIERAFLEP